MLIVINGGSIFNNNYSVENRRYFAHCLSLLIREKPHVEFSYLTDQYLLNIWQPEPPAGQLLVKKSIPGPIGSAIWRRWQAPAAIHDRKPDLFFSIGDPGIKTNGIPQCIWMAGPHPVPVALDQGSLLLTASGEAAKGWLEEQKIPLPRLTTVPFAADDDYQPLAWTEKENIKVKYAGGKEFFVTRSYFGEEQLLMLLKAFSLFKKRQQSNIQLLIISMDGDKDHSPVEKLENYKYRNDVHLYPGLTEEEFIQINASAYAFLQPVKEFDGNGLLNAFQALVPVISTATEREEETTGAALLFATYNDHEQMADQMMTLFKDENLRNELIRKGKIKARELSMQQAARTVWKGMMQAIDINPNN